MIESLKTNGTVMDGKEGNFFIFEQNWGQTVTLKYTS